MTCSVKQLTHSNFYIVEEQSFYEYSTELLVVKTEELNKL
jgi:hypothetical protein